jgi:hypothetical protein
MDARNVVLDYVVNTYFKGSLSSASEMTGYSEKQFSDWLGGIRQPQKATLEYIMHCILTPEFKVVAEYAEFSQGRPVKTQLKEIFKGHEERAGIYAFYDSMARLLYVGKAGNILDECYSAINRSVDVKFPAGLKNRPQKRSDIVRYISAYDVGRSGFRDYPKHVESLILRISKPPLNKVIGTLDRAYSRPEDE